MRRGPLICRTLSGLALAAFFSSSGTLRAEPSGRLVYDAGPSSAVCPDEAGMRAAVRTRLGEDPFTDSSTATRTFALSIEAQGERLVGSVELKNEDGTSAGRRTVNGKAGACDELVEALALSVSLAINPDLVVESSGSATPGLPPPPPAPPADPAEPAGPAVVAEPAPKSVAPANPVTNTATQTVPQVWAVPATTDRGVEDGEERRVRLGVMTGAFAHGALGTGPGAAAGGSVMVRVRTSSHPSDDGRIHLRGSVGRRLHVDYSVGLEGRFDGLAQDRLPSGGTVNSNLVAAVITPCAHLGAGFGCPALMAGKINAHSEDVASKAADSGVYVAAGGRVGTEVPLTEHLKIELRLDVLAPLVPVSIVFDGATVWTSGVSGTLGTGLVGQIP